MSNGNGGAQLVLCNVPARDPSSLVPFYNALLDTEFIENPQSPIPQYYETVTADGVDLTITRRNDAREVTVAYWHVPDIDAAIEKLQGLGGELTSAPTETPDGGQTALMLDPQGNFVGLLQLSEDSHEHFRAGKFRGEFAKLLQRRREEVRAR